jgi:hypothetical protein
MADLLAALAGSRQVDGKRPTDRCGRIPDR